MATFGNYYERRDPFWVQEYECQYKPPETVLTVDPATKATVYTMEYDKIIYNITDIKWNYSAMTAYPLPPIGEFIEMCESMDEFNIPHRIVGEIIL